MVKQSLVIPVVQLKVIVLMF
ncbi:Protein of unknown function [Bacillus wiedmannii]|nr:Protein of unknown function [Bacillus wiedmannii]